MRPRSATQLGIDYARLASLNPALVYAFSAGYDQSGPSAAEPAYDDVIQAAAGVAALNANERGEPRYLATILCDKVGGLHLAIAVAAALARRAQTGVGCCIEAPMFESTVSFLMTEQLGGASFEPPLGPTGYDRLASPNRRPFPTRDGYLAILPYTTTHWAAFFELIGRPEQAHSPQVQDPVVRSRDIDALYSVIAAVAPTRTSAEWLADLRRLDIPCARVNAVGDLLQDDHLRATGFFREYDHPTEGRMRDARSPFRLHGAPEQADRPTPRTGADGREVLVSVGYSDAEIERFAATGLVALTG
jgi:crotonobetainyl-CoA:carnitine CoA-transferase CaiB-like acyl-CoA transferase